MKLSAQQIAKIEETLFLNGIQYDDIQLELTDHIASEIEEKISIQGCSFDVAFYDVFENWKEQLRPTTSFWVGKRNILPKIIMDKWIEKTKKEQKLMLVISIILTLILTKVTRIIENQVVFDYLRIIFRTILFLELTLLVIGKWVIRNSKYKTTFSLFYNVNSFPIIMFLFFIVIGLFPIKLVDSNLVMNLLSNFCLIVYLVSPIYYFNQIYQHSQFIKKIKFSL